MKSVHSCRPTLFSTQHDIPAERGRISNSNLHVHGVRPVFALFPTTVVVSIHAPARGATFLGGNDVPASKVSIHAPARGATLRSRQVKHVLVSFNPRTRTGCDMDLPSRLRLISAFQSTHPHGVRRPATPSGELGHCFNPRTRTGCDNQSPLNAAIVICFNPRTRTGCDFRYLHRVAVQYVSIHAPARGATCAIYVWFVCPDVSIHAPARGATFFYEFVMDPDGFQSTHPHGVRRQGDPI